MFYVTRDTSPSVWYPLDLLGNPLIYNDLPVAQQVNVNVTEGPYNRLFGQTPALTSQEISELIAFLRTLSDGYMN